MYTAAHSKQMLKPRADVQILSSWLLAQKSATTKRNNQDYHKKIFFIFYISYNGDDFKKHKV